MTDANSKSVKMTYKALLNYIMNTHYRSFAGISGLLLSIAAIVILVLGWGQLSTSRKGVLILVGCAFTVINPLMLAFKALQQLKLSPSYRKPLDYTFSDKGITVRQGDLSNDIPWESICRIMMTKHIFAIYTSRINAFVIPISELGEEKGKIIASVVQFTAQYKPALSKNLSRYQTGKGI